MAGYLNTPDLIAAGNKSTRLTRAVGFAIAPAAGTANADTPILSAGEGGASTDKTWSKSPAGSLRLGIYSSANTTVRPEYKYNQTWYKLVVAGLPVADSVKILAGTGSDVEVYHDGTNSYLVNNTGNLIIDNKATTGKTYVDLGTDTSATAFAVRNNSGTALFQVNGAGTITAGAGMWAGAPSPADPDPSKAHVFFRDFIEDEIGATGWVVIEDDAADTQVASDAQHGKLVLTCKATTDNDACQAFWAQETFKLTSGKSLWYEARVRCPAGDATNLDFWIGLAETEDLTGVADNMPANGFGFRKDDGDTHIDIHSSDGGTDTSGTERGTLVNATWIKLGLKFNGGASGAGTLTPYIDGTAGTAITVTYATMAELAPGFMIRNGDGTTTQVLEIDYVKVVTER